MRYYFVDYENVDVAGFDGLGDLSETDAVYIYYSERHNRMTFGLHRRIMASDATFKYRKIQSPGKDALDIELMRELKTVITQNEELRLPIRNEYCIITMDKGYGEFVKSCRERGIKMEICANIKEACLTDEERLRMEKSRLEADIALIRKEKEKLLQEKKALQTAVEAMRKQEQKREDQKREECVKTALRSAGMTKLELKAIEQHLGEIVCAEDRLQRNKILTKLIHGKKLKGYLDALERI